MITMRVGKYMRISEGDDRVCTVWHETWRVGEIKSALNAA
jgi:hypothetical protein